VHANKPHPWYVSSHLRLCATNTGYEAIFAPYAELGQSCAYMSNAMCEDARFCEHNSSTEVELAFEDVAMDCDGFDTQQPSTHTQSRIEESEEHELAGVFIGDAHSAMEKDEETHCFDDPHESPQHMRPHVPQTTQVRSGMEHTHSSTETQRKSD
jgi:hypothetical protein